MTVRVRVARSAICPDPLRVARAARAPEVGPRLLFLSGGSALRPLCRILKRYTHNSVHLITAFDSGGSSATLRLAFPGMLSVGDLRNRLMALADEGARGNPPTYRLFSHRFPSDRSQGELAARLEEMVAGRDLVADIPSPMRRIVRTYLKRFAEARPQAFDLQGASIGNLILAGGYVTHDADMDSVVFLFSKLVAVRGTVLPIVDAGRHLAVDLADGSRVVGQHRFTGKELPAVTSAIVGVELVDDLERDVRAPVTIHGKVRSLIEDADLVCYPYGSFWSSIVCNLLPDGVGRALASLDRPKIYIPSTGHDPEQLGMTVGGAVEQLMAHVRIDAGSDTAPERILNLILVDPVHGDYRIPLELDRVRAAGVGVVELPLCDPATGKVDPQRLTEVLLSLT